MQIYMDIDSRVAKIRSWTEASGLTQGKLADLSGLDQSQVSRFFNGKKINSTALFQLLDAIGAIIVFPDDTQQDTAKEVCFVDAKAVNAPGGVRPADSDYVAVPLASEAVAAGPGIMPQDAIKGWVMVWRHHDSVRFTRNLVAVEIGKGEESMLPTFSPGDILLVDRNNRNPERPGNIWLVCEPDGACAIKRVASNRIDGDVELTFYSDSAKRFPPKNYRLNQDYEGDINRAIAGRVVWAWSDVREK